MDNSTFILPITASISSSIIRMMLLSGGTTSVVCRAPPNHLSSSSPMAAMRASFFASKEPLGSAIASRALRRAYVLDRVFHRFCCLPRGLQRISSTIGVSGRRSLPIFRPRNVKGSGASKQSKATGTNFATYCIISSRPCQQKNHCRGNAAIGPYPAQTQEREGIKRVVVPRQQWPPRLPPLVVQRNEAK